MVENITAQQAQELINKGAKFIDIRSPEEFSRERLEHSTNIPAEELAIMQMLPSHLVSAPCLIFHCQSGFRTKNAIDDIDKFAEDSRKVYILEGGLNAWKNQGYATDFDPKQPLPIMRQVQVAAGSLVLLGTVLAFFSKFFLLITAFVGGGLVFAGLTGFCGMAKVLEKAPWNEK